MVVFTFRSLLDVIEQKLDAAQVSHVGRVNQGRPATLQPHSRGQLQCDGRPVTLFVLLASALFSSSNWTTSSQPLAAASCSAVHPSWRAK